MFNLFHTGNMSTLRFNKGQAFTMFIVMTCMIYIAGYFAQTVIFASGQSGLATIYHVYIDDEYIGKVDDKMIVEDVVEQKLHTEADESEESIELVIDENITYIIEKSFNPRSHNKQISNKLQDMLTVKAQAYALKIGDEVVGHFSDKDQANDVIMQYQLTHINEEDIENLQVDQPESPHLMAVIDAEQLNDKTLAVGESQLVDVKLSDEVKVSEQRVEPEEILTVKEGLTILEKGTLEEEKHLVAEGEVLGSIASQYDLTTKDLLKLNPEITEKTLLQIDQKLNVTALKPFVDVIIVEEEMVEEKVPYKTEVVESDKMYKGEQKVTQKGKNGKKQVHYKVEKTNGKESDREVLDEEIINKPTKKVVVKGTKVIPSRGSGEFTWPTNGGYVSSNFGPRWGRMHKGIDIARPSNRTIKAADHGVVSFVGYKGGYGNKIVINHNNGMKTLYAHLSSMNVRVGQTVEKGSAIGVMGSTGHSTGVHLHFEIHKNGVPQNPLKYY